MEAQAQISSTDFEFLTGFIKKRSGIQLTSDKMYLVESRLMPIARELGYKTLTEFVNFIRYKGDEKLFNTVIEAMTTNESSFFRDGKPFQQLKDIILPRIYNAVQEKGRKQVRIWSAACSTGQEAYSVALTLAEMQGRAKEFTHELIATDIAQKVIDRAKEGIYSQFEVQRGLPIQMLVKYFTQLADNNWQLQPSITNTVQFKLANLLEDYSYLGKFDIIFCRNVLIYFDEPTKAAILKRLKASLEPHGILYLGSTETIIGISDAFKPLANERGIYEPS